MSCLTGMSTLAKLGIPARELIPVTTQMRSADNDHIELLGAIFMELSGNDEHGSHYKSKQMVYIAKGTEAFYLNRSACRELGIISDKFPTIGENGNSLKTAAVGQGHSQAQNTRATEVITTELAPCGCPKRTIPSPITNPPCEFSENNRELLEKFLKDQFKSSTFNVCTHQLLPEMHGPPMRLMVDRTAKPIATHKARPVPVHFQEKVKEGLDSDVRLGVIEPVPDGTPTTWCHQMVICSKKCGSCRRTVDFQALNNNASRETHHTPSPYQLAREVPSNMKKTTFDAWNGYHSIKLHKSDHHFTTFITPWGRFRYIRCPQGYIASGDAYTRRYDNIIANVKNKVKCIDDTLMWANNIEESYKQAVEYLVLCGRNGIILNPNKFHFAKDKIEFAGFTIGNNSIAPIPTFLKAIENFPQPQNITDIRSWFGLVNQAAYSFSKCSVMEPFRELMKKGSQFVWNEDMEKAFKAAKATIKEKIEKGVRIFEKNRKTCLATDWSQTGVGAWLLQKHCECDSSKPFCCPTGWHVTLFCSRYTTDAESRYAPIEGESLAVVFGLEKCKHFVLGCSDLIIAVDHKPLIGLYTKRSLEDIPNARLRNLKEKTLPFRFQMIHVAGVKNKVADCLSRSPSEAAEHMDLIDDMDTTEEQDGNLVTQTDGGENITNLDRTRNMTAASATAITLDMVANHTMADPAMRELLITVENGFPDSVTEMPAELTGYHKHRDHLSSRDGLVTYKQRVVLPKSLRQEALKFLHAAHQGTSSMTSRAEQCIFWPGITNDIKEKRENCMRCHRSAPSNPNAPPQDITVPEYPFQMICADYFNYRGNPYLIIVDRYSGWPIVKRAQEGATGLINALKDTVNIFGVPQELSSDGGPEFTAMSTKKVLKDWGTHHRISSVAHARSNGRAEVAVKSMKRLLMDNTGPSGNLNNDEFLRAILQYRNTPDTATGISPAMYIFHRPIRDFLPDLNIGKSKENWNDVITAHQEARENHLTEYHTRLHEHTRRLPPLRVGDKVFIQNQIGSAPTKWDNTGEIMEVRQFDQYVVRMDSSGRRTLRNRKYLRIWNKASYKPQIQEVRPTDTPTLSDVKPTATPHIPNVTEPSATAEPEPYMPNVTEPSTTAEPEPHMPNVTEPSTPAGPKPTIDTQPTATNESEQPEPLTRRSHRIKKPPDRLKYIVLGQPE